MIKGNPSTFAIESQIDEFYERESLMGLGYYVLHVAGSTYGSLQPRATMLACSFDAVSQRLKLRGHHRSNYSDLPAPKIILQYLKSYYDESAMGTMSPIDVAQFQSDIELNNIVFAPDGDSAFDDGSHVLQFDLGSKVRIIAFRNLADPRERLDSINDVHLDEALFYEILRDWMESFTQERNARLKNASLNRPVF